MPKAFDESEKDAIRAALLEAGLWQFEKAGLRATRIDDICRAVSIAKGSFYAFFPSKEELFMTIVEQREAQHRADMYEYIDKASGPQAKRAGGLFDLILAKIESDPVLNLIVANDEITYLTRKLGPERFETSRREDRAFARDSARRWRAAGGTAIDPSDLLALMTLCLAVAVQRRQMTADQYKPTVKLLRQMFIARLTGSFA